MPNNTLNLKQKVGGRRIKQADQSSVLAYQLYDEYFNTIPDIEGMTATVKLYQEDTVHYQTKADVTAGRVGFKISEPIPVGVYIVEIAVGGYVFPSDRATTLEVVEGATKFEIKELVPLDLNNKLAEIEKLVSQSQHADLSNILADISLIKEQMANVSSYDDQPLRDLIDNLRQSIPQAYDDTALIGRIQALEDVDLSEYAKRSELTTFDNTENERRLTELENRPASSYDDTEIKQRLTDLENANADLSTKNYVLEKASTNITMGGGAPAQQTDTARRMMRLNKLGLGITHLDFKTLASNVTGPIFTLPNDAPAPKQLIEIQFHNGATAWINAGTRTVSTENLPANTRYIVDWIGFYL